MSQDRPLNQEEKKRLLEIARGTIQDHVQGRRPASGQPDLEGLGFQRGAFVTIHRHGALRGCIGNFFSDQPLINTIEEMAVAASSHDPRFPPVSPVELEELDLEISVLSPLREIDDVSEIKVGEHGIYIVSPHGRGVLLPQVATEYGWDRDTFLDQT
jgi:AmmeMemoRadiSam system protein A